ncbi:MAG: hypothetical protein ACLFSQ_08710 [Candidatus Zixiibacteriota bacterium]
MKKLLYSLLIIFVLFAFLGCDEDPEEDIVAPSNLMLESAGDGTSLLLTWTESTTEDVSYRITFNGATVTEDLTTNTYTHNAPEELGEYSVVAYTEDQVSDPTTASSATYSGSTSDYVWKFTSSGQSGYGWYADGTGEHYSFTTENFEYIDVYLDNDLDIVSPDVENGSANTTYLVNSGDYDIDAAPSDPASYSNNAAAGLNDVFVAMIPATGGNYYLKAQITSLDEGDGKIQFSYDFQTIQGFRLLD